MGRSQMILQKEFCALYSGERTVLPKQSVYVDVVECRHPRLRSWCQQWRESSSLSIRTIKKVHRNNNSTHTKIYMSKSRVHAKANVPFGISAPEICCPSVCQNWSGLPGFNLDGNTRGRDVLLRYYFCRCNSFDHYSWFIIRVLQAQTLLELQINILINFNKIYNYWLRCQL